MKRESMSMNFIKPAEGLSVGQLRDVASMVRDVGSESLVNKMQMAAAAMAINEVRDDPQGKRLLDSVVEKSNAIDNAHDALRGEMMGVAEQYHEVDSIMIELVERLVKSWEKSGRKTLRPSVDMCRAFEQVELSFPCGEYEQPYDFLCIEFPPLLVGKLGYDRCFLFKTDGCLIFCSQNSKDWMTTSINIVESSEKILEEKMLYTSDPLLKGRITTGLPVIRVALNSCVAATHFRTELKSPSCPHKQWPNKKRRAWEREAPEIIDFVDQNIRWYDAEGSGPKDGEPGTHISPTAHWRKGHWRSQAHGPKNSLRKKVFIRPVFVNARFYIGTHEKDSTTYTARG